MWWLSLARASTAPGDAHGADLLPRSVAISSLNDLLLHLRPNRRKSANLELGLGEDGAEMACSSAIHFLVDTNTGAGSPRTPGSTGCYPRCPSRRSDVQKALRHPVPISLTTATCVRNMVLLLARSFPRSKPPQRERMALACRCGPDRRWGVPWKKIELTYWSHMS